MDVLLYDRTVEASNALWLHVIHDRLHPISLVLSVRAPWGQEAEADVGGRIKEGRKKETREEDENLDF